MIDVTIILKAGKKSEEVTWTVDSNKHLSIKDDGVTIYNSDGTFRAFYYASNVIGVELSESEGDS